MRKQLLAAGLALSIGMGYSLCAFAQAKPETLVKQRQAAMTLMGKYFFSLGPMAQGKAPYDAAVFARNAGYLDVLSKLPWDGFTPATAEIKSATLPEAYKDAAKFKASPDAMQVEIGKLVAVTKSGNEASVKTAFGDTLKTCIACHDGFRAKQ